jgi:hypothetical protein
MNAVACGAGQLHLCSLHARLPSMAPATNRRFEGRLLQPGRYDQVAGSPMDQDKLKAKFERAEASAKQPLRVNDAEFAACKLHESFIIAQV